MVIQVEEFINNVTNNLNDLIEHLSNLSGRSTPNERESWSKSLPILSKILSQASQTNSNLTKSHISISHLALEYRLPSASAWCDAVIIGKNLDNKPTVYIIELKHWDTENDTAGLNKGLITHKNLQFHHPSDQLKGYIEYCQRFHSAVEDYKANVTGSVLFTTNTNISAYNDDPNKQLAANYPLFNSISKDEFVVHLNKNINDGDENFAIDFQKGYYRQNRNILNQVANQLSKSRDNKNHIAPYVLLDEQRKGYALIESILDNVNKNENKGQKHVIIVEGPPGSGKSALAINLWIDSVLKYIQPRESIKKNKRDRKSDPSLTDNIVFVTTSSSQKSNWQTTFDNLAPGFAAKGFVLPANQFNPGITGNDVSKLRMQLGINMYPKNWQENLQIYFENGGKDKAPDNHHFLSICDEAHALINTEGHNIGFASGWVHQAGPQAYHIIRCSKISVFFTDNLQSYRDSETTTTDNIKDFASRLGAKVNMVSLEDQQFRCGGSKEYIQFIDDLFKNNITNLNTSWRKTQNNPNGAFSFEVLDNPFRLDDNLNNKIKNKYTARILSSYSRKWVTKKNSNPHNTEPNEKDFYIDVDGQYYSKIWNYAPKEDYSVFIQGIEGSAIHQDPLCEVGCPYVVRGFDYDYLGLLWLDDLVYRNGNWQINIENIHETALKSSLKKAKEAISKRKKKGISEISDAEEILMQRIKKGYRILLSRAIKGMYIYIHDEETRNHINSLLR